MKTELEVTELLDIVTRDDELHTIIMGDMTVKEVETAKEILEWVLK